MEHICIGEIIKAQGIKGEVKVKPLTDDITRYKKLKIVYIDGKPFKMLNVRLDASFVYIAFMGIDDRDKAEEMRGKKITIERVNAIVLPDDSFFISDIVGCKLYNETGKFLGNLTDVLQHGAADVFVAKADNGKEFRFPFLKKIFTKMDIENKQLVALQSELDGVCVYDD